MPSLRPALPLIPLLLALGCSSSSSLSTGPYDLTQAVALADLNGDGRLDPISAVSTYGNGAPHPGFLSLRFQSASPAGTFQDPVRLGAGSDPYALAVGDLNGDGRPDLVAVNTQTTGGAITANTASILLSGPTAGSFQPVQSLALGTRDPLDLALGDLNGDGRLDLVVASRGAANLQVFFQGPSGFGGATLVALGAEPTAVLAADLNGDGRLDLAATTRGNVVSVLLQNPAGPGTFGPAADFAVGSEPVALRAVDLDGDGRRDLAVVNHRSASGGLSLLRQDPAHPGAFLAAIAYDTGDYAARNLAVGDLDGDGRPDVVVANAGAPGHAGTVAVFRQDPAHPGHLLARELYWGYWGPTSVAIGDLNGDGRPDLLVADGDPAVRFQDAAHPGAFFAPTWLRY